MRIGVIGGGAFGVVTAARLAAAGAAVTLFERLPELMRGASANANRLHQGFHYPRHDETARQCARGFPQVVEAFGAAVLPGVGNAYFIARERSLTSAAEFLAFCRRLDLRHRPIDLERFDPVVRNVDLGVSTDELMYDRAVLRRLMIRRLERSGAESRVGVEVTGIERSKRGGFELETRDGREPYDAVVNCAYADLDRLSARLGHPVEARQYEYAAAAIVDLDWRRTVSLTVLDGPFLSLLPLDLRGRYLLYHVEQAVIARYDGAFLDPAWLDPDTSPFSRVDRQRWFAALIDSCSEFVPALRDARLQGFLQGPRMVRSHHETTDARLSTVTQLEPGYLAVLSGKIDHCLWVADQVTSELGVV